MAEYQKPYHILLDAAERAIEQIEACNFGEAKAVLIAAEQAAEEAYLREDAGGEAEI